MVQYYKQLCVRCKKNYVKATRRDKFVSCFVCDEKEMNCKIEDPEMKTLFDIPQEMYKENNFLRDIKKNYCRYGGLTERQVEAFKEAVERMKAEK